MNVSLSNYNEKDLLLLIADGDEFAFSTVYDHYKNEVYSFAIGITRSVSNAEEIVQESFIKVWTNRMDLPKIEKFESWLFVIVRNHCYDILRKKALELKIQSEHVVDEHSDYNPDDILIARENQKFIREAIDHLPWQQKHVYMLREQGLSYDEIAEKLQISRNTVKEHVVRSNASIRIFLKKRITTVLLSILLLNSHI